MKNLILFLFLFLLTLVLSCRKDGLQFDNLTITELTESFEPDARFRNQLRLAFGKTLANALSKIALKDYIIEKSLGNRDGMFEEIVFSQHYLDEIYPGITFAEFLRRSVDDEVKAVFGDDFIETVLRSDPLLVIKLPDIFYNLGFRGIFGGPLSTPMVYVKTPNPVPNPHSSFFHYIVYHHSGYREFVPASEMPPYYGLVVKYSEDYMLLNTQNLENEKGIQLAEILPQYLNCNADFLDSLEMIGKPVPELTEFKLFSKKEVFLMQKNLCNPFSFAPACAAACGRDCVPLDSLNNVFQSFSFKNPLGARITDDTQFFKENRDALVVFATKPDYVSYKIATIGVRLGELLDRSNVIVSLRMEDKFYQNAGRIFLPKFSLFNAEFDDSAPLKYPVEVLISKGWPASNPDDAYTFTAVMTDYSDAVNPQFFTYDASTNEGYFLNTSNAIQWGRTSLQYCIESPHTYDLGDINIEIKY